ncbi:MAG: hypothetical protein WC627_11955 [Legionella sp.]|jgi:hypothetical protein
MNITDSLYIIEYKPHVHNYLINSGHNIKSPEYEKLSSYLLSPKIYEKVIMIYIKWDKLSFGLNPEIPYQEHKLLQNRINKNNEIDQFLLNIINNFLGQQI